MSERVAFFGFDDDLPRIATGGVFMKGGCRSGKISVGEFFECAVQTYNLLNGEIFSLFNDRDT